MHSPLQPGRHDGSFPPHACPALPRPVTDHLLTSTPPLAAPGPWWLAATKGQGDVPQLPSLQPCHPSLCASIGASKCTRPDRSYLARYPAWPFAVGVNQARWTASTHCPQQPPPPHRDPRPKPSSCSPPAASVMAPMLAPMLAQRLGWQGCREMGVGGHLLAPSLLPATMALVLQGEGLR